MSSKRRLRRKECTRKVRHPTRAAAKQAARRMGKANVLSAYRCRWCGNWHLGHYRHK